MYKTSNYLKNSIAANAVKHCYLLVTPVKNAADEIFYGFAKALFCKRGGCGECAECRRIAGGSHSGIRVFPDKLTAENAGEIVGDLYIKPIDGDYKLYYIAQADAMLPAVQNKLLKSLEEPPPYAVFFLAAANEDSVLKTVASRCEKLYETYLDIGAAEEILSKEFAGDEFALHAALCADGFTDKARELIKDVGFRKLFSECVLLMNRVKKSGDIAQFLNSPAFEKEHIKTSLHILTVVAGATLRGIETRENKYIYIKDTDAPALSGYIYLLQTAQKKARFNVNPLSIAESLLMGMLEVKYMTTK